MENDNEHANQTENRSGPQPADLARDTAVCRVRAAPGWYTAEMPAHWNYFTPSGGVLMTVALRAMQAEVPDLRPCSATALFCSPVPDGPLSIRVEVLRRGNVAAQVRAALSSTSKRLPGPGLEVSATFVRDLADPVKISGTFVSMPKDIPAPAASHLTFSGVAGSGPVPFFRNFENRTALGHTGSEVDFEPGPPRHAHWYRYLVPQRLDEGRLDNGRLDPLCLPPLADTMPPALRMAVGPRPPFYAPSLDLTVHFLSETDSEWLCAHTTSRYADKGYATADVEIWDEAGRLVAFGTQMMLLKKAPG